MASLKGGRGRGKVILVGGLTSERVNKVVLAGGCSGARYENGRSVAVSGNVPPLNIILFFSFCLFCFSLSLKKHFQPILVAMVIVALAAVLMLVVMKPLALILL